MKVRALRYEASERIYCSPKEATHIEFRIPSGILEYRELLVQIGGTRAGTNNWSCNGDLEKPTLKPSILTQCDYAHEPFRCHTFINDGMVQFLNDCSHENAGKTLELLEM